jgi:hypothetical protein
VADQNEQSDDESQGINKGRDRMSEHSKVQERGFEEGYYDDV